MIIGISGKATSGKGTTCDIIQAIDVYYNSGKRTDSWGTLDEFVWKFTREGRRESLAIARDIYSIWDKKYFAQPVKSIIAMLTGCYANNLYTQEGKAQLSPISKPEGGYFTYRELLQLFGTNVGRSISENLWVDALFSGYNDNSNWLVEDVRFPNEFQKIRDMGGLLIRCDREDIIPMDHPSETALDTFSDKFDYHIKFDPTLKSMTKDILLIMKEHKFI